MSNIYDLLKQFGILCDDEYKLVFIGVVNGLSRFFILPISGMLSDR